MDNGRYVPRAENKNKVSSVHQGEPSGAWHGEGGIPLAPGRASSLPEAATPLQSHMHSFILSQERSLFPKYFPFLFFFFVVIPFFFHIKVHVKIF